MLIFLFESKIMEIMEIMKILFKALEYFNNALIIVYIWFERNLILNLKPQIHTLYKCESVILLCLLILLEMYRYYILYGSSNVNNHIRAIIYLFWQMNKVTENK